MINDKIIFARKNAGHSIIFDVYSKLYCKQSKASLLAFSNVALHFRLAYSIDQCKHQNISYSMYFDGKNDAIIFYFKTENAMFETLPKCTPFLTPEMHVMGHFERYNSLRRKYNCKS